VFEPYSCAMHVKYDVIERVITEGIIQTKNKSKYSGRPINIPPATHNALSSIIVLGDKL
jgi:hypothetical protein